MRKEQTEQFETQIQNVDDEGLINLDQKLYRRDSILRGSEIGSIAIAYILGMIFAERLNTTAQPQEVQPIDIIATLSMFLPYIVWFSDGGFTTDKRDLVTEEAKKRDLMLPRGNMARRSLLAPSLETTAS